MNYRIGGALNHLWTKKQALENHTEVYCCLCTCWFITETIPSATLSPLQLSYYICTQSNELMAFEVSSH